MKTAKKKSKRAPGRPKPASRISPEEISVMANMFLRGASYSQIAEHIGCHKSTVQKHIKESAMPAWREAMQRDLAVDLAELSEIEQIAWQELEKCWETGEVTETVKQTLGSRGKLKIAERLCRTIRGRGALGWAELIKSMIEFRCRVRGDLLPERMEEVSPVIPVVEVIVEDRSELEQPIPLARFQEMVVSGD